MYRMWACREDIGPRLAMDRIRTPHWWQPVPTRSRAKGGTLSPCPWVDRPQGWGQDAETKERLGNSRPYYFGGKIHDGAWGGMPIKLNCSAAKAIATEGP